jgi:hypothetical protein
VPENESPLYRILRIHHKAAWASCDGTQVELEGSFSEDWASQKGIHCGAVVGAMGWGAFIVDEDGKCFAVQVKRCALSGRRRSNLPKKRSTFNVQKRNYPILNAVSTMSGSPNGHTRLEITGDYLMEGAHGHADMSDLSPELVVCAGRQACDVDYFSSDSKKLVCLTRPTLHPRGIAALSVAICDGSEGTCLVPSQSIHYGLGRKGYSWGYRLIKGSTASECKSKIGTNEGNGGGRIQYAA